MSVCITLVTVTFPDPVIREIEWSASNGGGGGSSGGQIVAYTSAPPANPDDLSSPAIAYDPTGVLPTLGWSVAAQSWYP